MICVELLCTSPLLSTVLTVLVLHGCLHGNWCHVTWHIDNGCFIFLCVVTIVDRKYHSVAYSVFLELNSSLLRLKEILLSVFVIFKFFYFQGCFILDTFLALN